ncbi:recombinase RecT [Rothia sp. AR01]|uniref:Recombinase RecT n=1 Tax=Rothia santali TaxID=2949643 RepID=A0A9X2HAZ6_9MICC|nr:RecT family recombinase [Rothia santali]MCP3426006.1 recombinase RecT [Rothia santali]
MTSNQLAEQAKSLVFANAGQHKTMLPADQQDQVNGWLSAAYAAIMKDPNLANAAMSSPGTLMNALNEAAQLGLRPGTKEYYLTPRKNKGRWEVLGVVGYQGEVNLMYRSGAVSSVIVETVHAQDAFAWDPGTMDRPEHAPNWFGERGPLIGAYAYAIMQGGAVSKVVVTDQTRIRAAMDASAGSDSQYSPWKKHPRAMYLKTAAHDLAKWVPTSAEDKRVEAIRAGVGQEAARAARERALEAAGGRAVLEPVPVPEEPAPGPQEVVGEEYAAAIAADDVDPATGELHGAKPATKAQRSEIRKRFKALQVASSEADADREIRAFLNDDGHGGLGALSFEEADAVLAEFAA